MRFNFTVQCTQCSWRKICNILTDKILAYVNLLKRRRVPRYQRCWQVMAHKIEAGLPDVLVHFDLFFAKDKWFHLQKDVCLICKFCSQPPWDKNQIKKYYLSFQRLYGGEGWGGESHSLIQKCELVPNTQIKKYQNMIISMTFLFCK